MFWAWSLSKAKTHELDFFNWPSNLKKLVTSNDSKNARNMIQKGIKIAVFFQKNCKKLPNSRPPDPHLCSVWVKLVWLPRSPIWRILETFLTFGSSPFLWAKSRLHANQGRVFWSSFLRYFCLIKSPSFWIFLVTPLRVICSLVLPPIKNPGGVYVPRQRFFLTLIK